MKTLRLDAAMAAVLEKMPEADDQRIDAETVLLYMRARTALAAIVADNEGIPIEPTSEWNFACEVLEEFGHTQRKNERWVLA